MLIGLFAALTMALFMRGGQNSFFLDSSVQKDVKIYGTDKESQKAIFDIIDVMKKD